MRFSLNLACTTLMLILSHAANAQAAGILPATRFPVVVSYDLQKTKVTLPADLQGEMNLLIMPFEPEQQKEADSWTQVVKEVEASRPSFRHYLVPVFGRENFLYRWWMNSSLRSLLPAEDQHQSTIPIYPNRRRFLKQLEITSDREITVLLVEKNGLVLWRTTGPFTEAKRASLEAALTAPTKSGR